MKGYKVTNPDGKCKDFLFEVGKDYKHNGVLKICSSGFHLCLKASHCFSYYSFDSNNKVFEVEALGEIQTHSEDSKVATDHIRIIRQLEWDEVLRVSNEGADNTGHSNSGNSNSGNRNSGNWNSGNRNSGNRNSGYSNSGNSNSGNRNSGNWNSGNRNSGDRNSGYSNSGNWNSGNRNSGDSNSGDSNSGNWNSGNRNSGDSNSGYRNSGAFCIDTNPKLFLFDKPCKNMTVKEWENSRAYELMNQIDPTVWVPWNAMSEAEQKANPKYENSDGYAKSIPLKEAWANAWGNWSKENRKVFTDLENFDADKFKSITGIDVNA